MRPHPYFTGRGFLVHPHMRRFAWPERRRIMFTINANEMLTRVHKYELKRGADRFRIDVHEILAGTVDEKFFAIPSLLTKEDRDADEQYIGCGNTEEEALEDCLKKINRAPIQEIIPVRV
jgi:hypothetical protein